MAPKRSAGGSTPASSTAVGITDAGEVAGNADGHPFAGRYRPGRWLRTTSGGVDYRITVTDVNHRGPIAGTVRQPSGGPDRGVARWSSTSRAPRLVNQGADNYSESVDAEVDAVGNVLETTMLIPHQVLGLVGFTAAGSEVPLEVPGGNTFVAGLSDRGVGFYTLRMNWVHKEVTTPQAVVLRDGKSHVLQPVDTSSRLMAEAISPNGRRLLGRITPPGSGWDPDPQGPLAWLSENKAPQRLPDSTLGMKVRAVTDDGTIVGSKDGRAVLWSRGHLVDLSASASGLRSGWHLTEAVGINAHGDIAADAVTPSGATTAVELRHR